MAVIIINGNHYASSNILSFEMMSMAWLLLLDAFLFCHGNIQEGTSVFAGISQRGIQYLIGSSQP